MRARPRAYATTKAKRARRPYTSRERERRAQAVRAHVQQFGEWCPGWGIAGHPSTDLTADHVRSVASGGREDGPLVVLCRSCNGRKGSNLA